ncbi:15736_t:CDS:2, partial [Funneliformis geosporum]
LRVTGAEVCFKVEDPTLVTSYPLRVIINNVSGYVVKVGRVKTERESWILKSFTGFNALATNPHTPYPTKEWLQPRRYKAHLMAIKILWNRASHNSSNLKCPNDVLEAKELVLDENNNLQELERASGTNSFEDQFFYKATELARSLRISRVYLSANSGARIGLAEEVMNHFN